MLDTYKNLITFYINKVAELLMTEPFSYLFVAVILIYVIALMKKIMN